MRARNLISNHKSSQQLRDKRRGHRDCQTQNTADDPDSNPIIRSEMNNDSRNWGLTAIRGSQCLVLFEEALWVDAVEEAGILQGRSEGVVFDRAFDDHLAFAV